MDDGSLLSAVDSTQFPKPADEIPEGYSVAGMRTQGQVDLAELINHYGAIREGRLCPHCESKEVEAGRGTVG